MPTRSTLFATHHRLAQILALSGALSVAHAGSPAAAANPVAVAPRTPVSVAAPSTPLKRAPKAEHQLVGTWHSLEDEAKKTPPGNMFFQPNGAVLIAPDNYKPLSGTWVANSQEIMLNTAANGEARVRYHLSKDRKILTMQFANGMEQVFFRLPTKPGRKS